MTRLLFFCFLLALTACNPYKGFTGVDTSEIRGKKPPSVKIKEGHKKSEKKMRRAYKREMKRKARRMGTTKSK